MTLGGTSKDVPRAQMRRPRRLILDDHELTERCEVLTNRVIRQRSVRSPNVLGQRCRGGVRGDVASEASEQLLDFRWVVSSAVNARDVDAANLVEVVADCPQRLGDRQMAESWPPADGDLLRQFGDCETGSALRAGSPARSSAREIAPLLRPTSKRVIGRIRSRVIRPAPVCRVMSSAGTADPVRMNWPGRRRSSTVRRTWFQISGSICHSSMRRGVAPSSTRDGSTEIACRAFRSVSSSTSLAATCRAVAVLPHAFGPSITTAPVAPSRIRSSSSTILGRYGVCIRDIVEIS